MKRIILIITILIIIIIKIPLEENTDLKINYNELYKKKETQINSRSLEEPRELEPQIVIATEISEEGINFIKEKEGLIDKAKRLSGEKYLTIGYGHYGADVKESQTITEEEAERLLIADLKGYTEAVLRECEHLALNQNELDALVSFTYNCGLGNLKKLIKNRDKEEIAEHITAYTKSSSETNRKGLLERREQEKEMFLGN